MSRAIIFDGRLLQSSAWSRGMGRYLLGLLSGIAEREGEDTPRVVIIFSSHLPLPDERVEIVRSILPGIELHTLPIINNGYPAAETRNVKLTDNFISSQQLDKALFIQSSIFTFEYSPFYPTVTTNACIFYDMIPFKFWQMFRDHFPEHEYFRRFKFLYAADKVFSISDSVKSDLIDYLGFNREDIVNINGAYIPTFSESKPTSKKQKNHKYVLLPGGNAPHKNMHKAITGFAMFNSAARDSYKLLIPSHYSKKEQLRMKELSNNVELLGEVSDAELDELYKNAELVLFPSLDEGLGLPILEAVHYGKKIACSNIPIFRELAVGEMHFFDPDSPSSIAKTMTSVISSDKRSLQNNYDDINKRFTWQNSVQALLSTSVSKRSTNSSGRHSIVVEQVDSLNLVRKVSEIVRNVYPKSSVELFIDTLNDNSQHKNHPLIFNHVFMTRDIADVPTKSSKDRTFIITNNSKYSLALMCDNDDVIYLDTDEKSVTRRFKESFSPENQ